MTQTNHLSHFLLTNLLKPALVASKGRVINVTCNGQNKGRVQVESLGKEQVDSYYSTKRMNVLFTQELARRWTELGVSAYSLHPGLTRSPLASQRDFLMKILTLLLGKNSWQASQTCMLLACSPEESLQTGGHYQDCRLHMENQQTDSKITVQLWEKSAQLVKIN